MLLDTGAIGRHSTVMDRSIKTLIIGLVLLAIVIAILAGADAAMFIPQGGTRCEPKFPKWLGCVVANHENLAGGLIGAAGTLFAGWLAWTAIQIQVAEDQRRATADRIEVEETLEDEIDDIAEALSTVWEVLESIDETANAELNDQKLNGVRFGIEWVARESWLSTSRRMVQVLGWKRRRKYEALFDSLSALDRLRDPALFDIDDLLAATRAAANDCMLLDPETEGYFEGRSQRSPKAWSVGYRIKVAAGMEET